MRMVCVVVGVGVCEYNGRTIILNLAAGDGSDLSTSRGREEVFGREHE